MVEIDVGVCVWIGSKKEINFKNKVDADGAGVAGD